MEHSKKLSSTGEAREALGLNRSVTNANYAANKYWDACRLIAQLKDEIERLEKIVWELKN